jgi:hypothetical protein
LQSPDSSFFDFSLDLLPKEIFGTEETPEYILSDSSAEEEDAYHTRFYKENRMHLICAPGSNYTHMIDKRV